MYNEKFSKNFIFTNILTITIITNYDIVIISILYIFYKYIVQVIKYNIFSILKANKFYLVCQNKYFIKFLLKYLFFLRFITFKFTF